MNSSLPQIITIGLDLALSVLAFGLSFRPAFRQSYPWLFRYLGVRAVTAVALWFILYGPMVASPRAYNIAEFLVHWTSYLIGAVLLFLSCLDIYRQAMAPLEGLVWMGTTVFKWAALASILVTTTTLTSITFGPGMIVQIGLQMMRCAGTAELCLLTFLVLSMKAIGLSARSRPFGMALGLGLLAATDCVQSSLIGVQNLTGESAGIVFESISAAALITWILYNVLPEPARLPVTLAVGSPIYKWNEIARALGHKPAKVAPTPSHSFFLVDVEKVVDRAFNRNLKGKESES